jgi:hypothetical protein
LIYLCWNNKLEVVGFINGIFENNYIISYLTFKIEIYNNEDICNVYMVVFVI